MEDKIENYRGCSEWDWDAEDKCFFASLWTMIIGLVLTLIFHSFGAMVFSFGFWIFLYSISLTFFSKTHIIFPYKIKSRKIRVICKICLFIFLPITIIYIGLWAVYAVIKFIISAVWKCLTE